MPARRSGWSARRLAAGSVTPGGCDQAPGLLRATLRRIGRYDVETGARAGEQDRAIMATCRSRASASSRRRRRSATPARRASSGTALTLLVGGNNAVTRPGVHALGLPLDGEVGLITLDAHFDMRDTGRGLGNGNPVRALREDGLPGQNIAQIGLAPFANSAAMHRDAIDGGHLVVTIGEVRREGIAQAVGRRWHHVAHCEAIVVDCDIDVIDRGQLPGAPGARPGGMAAHDFFAAARLLAADPRVRLIDLTEWDPPLDPDRPQRADRRALGGRMPRRLRERTSTQVPDQGAEFPDRRRPASHIDLR